MTDATGTRREWIAKDAKVLTDLWCLLASDVAHALRGRGRDYVKGKIPEFYFFAGAVTAQGFIDASMKRLGAWNVDELERDLRDVIDAFWQNVALLAWCDGVDPMGFTVRAWLEAPKYMTPLAEDIQHILGKTARKPYERLIDAFLTSLFPGIAPAEIDLARDSLALRVSAAYEKTHDAFRD